MKFLEVLQTLAQENIDFIIVGGVAARLHGSTRLTQDLELFLVWKRRVGAN